MGQIYCPKASPKNKILFFLLLFLSSSVLLAQQRLPGANSSSSSAGNGKSFNFSQEKQLKRDIDDLGLTVANAIMNCCSTWGGTNVGATIEYDGVRMNELNGAFTIPMTVRWQGSLSGNKYWIKGKLVVTENSRSWLKIKDSGGFYPGCSKGCIK